MVFVLDNYDSFTYNLVQYLGELGARMVVRRNDQVTMGEVEAMGPSHIVISPGPGRPEDAGVTGDLIRQFGSRVPTLGVCLGHQAIGMVYGGRVVRAPVPMHGKTSVIEHDGRGVFAGLTSPIEASRYHSLVVAADDMPDVLEVCARTRDGIVMGVRHREYPVHGVQFHPESVLTADGRRMLRNFLGREIGRSDVLTELLRKLTKHQDLTAHEASAAMELVMTGQTTPAQLAAFLIGLAMKGERPEEIVGLARTMRAHAVKLSRPYPEAFDTCGTGGDGAGTINVSSAAALVIAASGVVVAKHGNRSASSRCGSADVLEALGVTLAVTPAVVERSLNEVGLAFIFAPAFHPSMKHAAPTRRELGLRTAFNLLGPLTNPVGPARQIVGVPRPELTELVARALLMLGAERAWVVHGADGLDEISTAGYTKVSEAYAGAVRTFHVHPADYGIRKAPLASIAGGDAAENAAIMRRLLDGEGGPVSDIVALNAGAGLFVAGRAGSVEEGIGLARAAIDTGRARDVLQRLVDVTASSEQRV